MVISRRDDTKLIVVPKELADKLGRVAIIEGVSLASYTSDALKEALRANEMGATLEDAVDLYQLIQVHRGAGAISVSRSDLSQVYDKLSKRSKKSLDTLWYNAGRWYGTYILTKLNGENIFRFLERDLLVSWNLDEVEIMSYDYQVHIQCTAFDMSEEFTKLFDIYINGLMTGLGYKESEKDVIRGLFSYVFLMKRE